MPIGAIAAAGAGLVGQAVNAFSQGNLNKRNRQFAREMYQTQKADNIEFWNMQNSYNSPEAMMKRYTDAGINPHTVTGNPANAQSISSPHMSTPDQQAVQLDVPTVVNGFFDIKQKAAQTNNTRLQGNLLALEAEKQALENKYLEAFLTERNHKAIADKMNSFLESRGKHWQLIRDTGTGSEFYPMSHPEKGSLFDLNARGLDLVNQLRRKELRAKDQTFGMNEQRRLYNERVFSPDASALSFKDWIQLILGGVQAFK